MTEHTCTSPTQFSTQRNDLLKLLALITMLIDHIGAVFFPEQMLWRTLGRIAFPIFSWQLVEGYFHTSSKTRYSLRIFVFGLLSQIPYMYLNPEIIPEFLHINIMFQLFTGVLLLGAVDKLMQARQTPYRQTTVPLGLLWFSVALGLVLLPDLISAWNPDFVFSYGTYGQLLFLLFYFYRGNLPKAIIPYVFLSVFHALEMSFLWTTSLRGIDGLRGLFNFWTSGTSLIQAWQWSVQGLFSLDYFYFQARSILALPIIYRLQDTSSGIRLSRWVGYWFYPLHMSALIAIKLLIT